MIKKEIKSFCTRLCNGEIYEGSVPFSLLSGMIHHGLCNSDEAEEGKASLPKACSITSEIELSESEFAKKYIFIKISGILAKGELLFNGKSCGMLNGPFREYLFDIRDKAMLGKNVIEIRCEEYHEVKQHLTPYGERSLEYDTALHVQDYAILRAPVIYVSNHAFIDDVSVRQEHKDGKAGVYVRAKTVGESDDVRVVASLSAPSGKIYFGGAYEGEIKITVPDPELWWPAGYGAQPIYKLNVTLYYGAEVEDVYEKKIGLRTVELSKNENEKPAVFVNGIKIFSRGATYVKQNAVFAGVSRANLGDLVTQATRSNMNTIVLFDENVPLCDDFYEYCDRLGILVWQSVTLPYIAPPAASVFASGVTDSVRDSIRRLSSHPSVALFFLSFAETDKEMMRLFKDSIEEFRAVSLRILTPVLNECAPNTPFITNSQDVFKHDERYLFEKDASYANGTLYALPSEYTLRSYLDDESYNLFSYASETKTNVPECIRMLENTVKYMKLPSGMSELVYASELAAGLELMRSVKLARRSGNCESAVLRQLNDGRKTVSSSLVDYFGKPKATLKLAAEAYAPIALDVIPCVDETVFWLTNSTKKDYRGRLVYSLHNMDGVCCEEKRCEVQLDSGCSSIIEKADFSRHIGENPDFYFVSYELYDDNGIIASGSEHFVPLKHVKFRNPEITAEISGMGKSFTVKLNSSFYAYAVKIDFDGINVSFSDNFVNLYGKTPVVISFETAEVVTPGELEKRLKIYSPYIIGR